MALLRPDTKTTFLCNACMDAAPYTGRYAIGYPGFDGICEWCGRLAQNLVTDEVNNPAVGGFGPFDFSTSVELAVPITIVWDVNCYYRRLGVRTDATKREIREAYQAAEGWNDEYLTYVVKLLLDPEKRATYDAIRPGAFYFDKYLRKVIEEEMRRENKANSVWKDDQEGEDQVPLEETIKADLDARMDKPVDVSNPNHHTVVDKDSLSEQTAFDQSEWGWYLWRSSCHTSSVLSEWRCLLALALRDKGVTTTLRVGLAGGLDAPWAVEPIGHRVVVFLSDRERPTREHAEGVAAYLTRR